MNKTNEKRLILTSSTLRGRNLKSQLLLTNFIQVSSVFSTEVLIENTVNKLLNIANMTKISICHTSK